tara:strand:- start:5570 stop:7420 length:1851 start_codon:yes stop_codon:yes gene_type:complete
MSYGFFPSFGLQLPSTPLAQGYTPMLEGGIRSADVAPVGTGQVNQDMSLNDRTQQVLDQANEILAQPQISPFQQFLMDNVDPLGLLSQPEQTPKAVTAPIKNITPREEAGPKSYARKGETPEVAFSPDFGFDIFPEGFYGQSEVRGTEAGPPEFGQEEVRQDQDTTIEPIAEEAQPDTAGPKEYQRKGNYEERGGDNPAKIATMTALDEYLSAARPGVEPGTYDDYIKEFGEATGLDVSGEPDNKMALMAFGLALMQNKAGKGFDVGEMLSSVGEAGEKAMPALQKAREQAKAIRAKAGEYALSRKKEDEAAAMAREGYYVIPAGTSANPETFLDAVLKGTGRREDFNAYELNALQSNEDFNKQFDIIPASMYDEVVLESIKAANEASDVKVWQEKPNEVALFGSAVDAPEWAKVDVFYADPNGPEPNKARLAGDYKVKLQQIASYERELDRVEQEFIDAAAVLEDTSITIPSQIGSSLTRTARGLGLLTTEGKEPTNIAKLTYILKNIEVSNTASILGEAGKTLSDVDRQLVRDIVGTIDFKNADETELRMKLAQIYKIVVTKSRQNINDSYQNLTNFGVPNEEIDKFRGIEQASTKEPTVSQEGGTTIVDFRDQ